MVLAVWPSRGRFICSRGLKRALWAVGAAPVARKEKQARDSVVHLGPKGAWPMTRTALACTVSGALCTGLCQRPAAVWSALRGPSVAGKYDGRLCATAGLEQT